MDEFDLGDFEDTNGALDDIASQASQEESHDAYGLEDSTRQVNLDNYEVDDDMESRDGQSFDNDDASSYAGSDLDPVEAEKKKRSFLFKIKRYQRKGMEVTKEMTIDDTLEDIIAEFESLKREANLETGMKYAKQGLVGLCMGIEFFNGKVDPLNIQLEGWAEEVQQGVDDKEYDEVLEELYDKYYDQIKIPAEVKLAMMLGGSAVSYHTKNAMFSGSKTEGAIDTGNINNMIASQENNMAIQQPTQDMSGPDVDADALIAALEAEGDMGDEMNMF